MDDHAVAAESLHGCLELPPCMDEWPAPRAERRDAAEHRQRILDVARDLFDRCGVDAVSMHQIAQAAGVGQGTLYRRYAHKAELCLALLGDSLTRLQADMQTCLVAAAPTATALEQLDYVLARIAAFDEESIDLLGPIIEAACELRRSDIYRKPFHRRIRQAIMALLRHAMARGEIAPLDADYTADAILAALAIDLYLFQRREQGYTPERIVQAVRRLYVEGLRAAATTSTATAAR